MTLDELAHAVWDRGASLYAVAGGIRYVGPALAADDPIRAAIVEHRDALLALEADYRRRLDEWRGAREVQTVRQGAAMGGTR